MKTYNLEERLINFAVKVIKAVDKIPKTSAGLHLGGQLLRSGTAPALNYGEAQAAESKKDFIHKMGIILKELRESKINLIILSKSELYKDDELLNESKELVAIFSKSIETAKLNQIKNS
jgi:four helix bundle protein